MEAKSNVKSLVSTISVPNDSKICNLLVIGVIKEEFSRLFKTNLGLLVKVNTATNELLFFALFKRA